MTTNDDQQGLPGSLDDRANLAGKVAVVIGGAAGLGEAVALGLAGAGVDVALCDLDGEALAATAARIDAAGRLRLARQLDVLEPGAVEEFFRAVDEVAERIDVLVNVVGGTRLTPFPESTPETWEADGERNFGYALRTIKLATERMLPAGGGSIVSITTIEAHRAAPGYAVYAGYKAALTNFTRSIAVELGREGVRVNTIAVENVPTPGTARIRPIDWGGRDRELEAYRMYVPMARIGTADEVANAVLFLVSDLASYVTGSSLHVDGGAFASSGWTYWPADGWYFPRASPATLARLADPADERDA